jgi:predicted lactoylglutathione lyase
MPRYTINDLQKFAKEKGGDCLSEKYLTNETLYSWKCQNGHTFTKVWVAVKTRNAWCLECKNCNGIGSLQKFAKEKGGRCLSTVYTRGDAKYEFECSKGHRFSCSWNNLKFNRKDWCSECKSITIDKLKKHAEEKGGKCLSEKYLTVEDSYIWQCSEGHIWEATWVNVGYGNSTWCKQCNIWSFENIYEKVKDKGCSDLKLVSGKGISGKYKFTCEEGHSWVTNAYNVINGNTWCSQCQKLNLEIAQKEAEKHGGKCLDDNYENRREEMTWQCSEGHIFKAPLGRIRNNGGWCKKCRDDSLKHDISVAHKIASEKRGKCLSSEYVNLETNLKWECKNGHVWDACLGNVMGNAWCNKCVMIKRREKCLDKIFAWVEKIGGSILIPREKIPLEIKSNAVNIEFQCCKKHIFTRTLQSIQHGSWCPKCRYKSEEACREIFESIYSVPFPKRRPTELEGLELDGYCQDLGIAFEYDGKQHYEYIPFFHRHGEIDLEKQQIRDKKKDRLCIENAICLVRIPYTFSYDAKEDLKEFIQTKLCEYGM